MIRKLAFHEISQKLPFQGNKKELNHYVWLFFSPQRQMLKIVYLVTHGD